MGRLLDLVFLHHASERFVADRSIGSHDKLHEGAVDDAAGGQRSVIVKLSPGVNDSLQVRGDIVLVLDASLQVENRPRFVDVVHRQRLTSHAAYRHQHCCCLLVVNRHACHSALSRNDSFIDRAFRHRPSRDTPSVSVHRCVSNFQTNDGNGNRHFLSPLPNAGFPSGCISWVRSGVHNDSRLRQMVQCLGSGVGPVESTRRQTRISHCNCRSSVAPTIAAGSAAAGPPMRLNLRSVTGQTIVVDGIDATGTVADLKKTIETQQNIPRELQRLIYRGRELCDGKAIAESGVADDDVLHLVMRPQRELTDADVAELLQDDDSAPHPPSMVIHMTPLYQVTALIPARPLSVDPDYAS